MAETEVFEKFKFRLGDLVTHIAGSGYMIVVERLLLQTTAGFHRYYRMSTPEREVVAEEMELELWQRPNRMQSKISQ